ncbi:hypothetical protein [Actinomadura luteofluorescens]|uniref:hypothetical protein n=1 Tax=Actinomadura luteofluorescens TaxID=46163 RepID=UPI003D8C469D
MIPLASSQAAVNTQAHSARAAAGTECVTYSFATACFRKHGDGILLYNGGNTSDDVTIVKWSNYLRTRSGAWKYYRKGHHVNPYPHNWSGPWKHNFYEDQSVNAYGGKGSGIRLYACVGGKGCSRYIWIRNSQ